VRSELVLISLVVASVTVVVRSSTRQVPQRAAARLTRRRPAPGDSDRERRGAAAASRIAWLGLVAATVGFLGHLVASAADPLWLALIVLAFVSLPAAVAAPWACARWSERAGRRRSSREWS
jgi:hypothetical protein